MHVRMIHVSLIIYPDTCVYDARIYAPRYLALLHARMMHVSMMHASLILDPDKCMMRVCIYDPQSWCMYA